MLVRWFSRFGLRCDLRRLLGELSPVAREELRATPEARLIRLHRRLGMGLRNGFRRGRFPFLLGHCRRQLEARGEPMSFDALSSEAIREIWQHLQTGA